MLVSSFENGFRYAVRQYGNAVGYCALSIKVGTRDEGGYHSGIAHFVEHTLFKGTSGKSPSAINNRLERLGGELNAYTTKEEIVLHATVLEKDLAKAASLLMEIALDARFPEEEIDTEKGVVTDELASVRDFPAEEIYDVFEERLFAGHDLARPILGTMESVKAISGEELRRFRDEFFTPERMVMTMVSPLEEKRMEKIIRKAAERMGTVSRDSRPARCIGSMKSTEEQFRPFDITENRNNNQTNCIIGNFAPSLADGQERLAALLLCNILGGPSSNSILGSNLRERHGWVYNVECNYTPYSDTGIAVISFGCDKENLRRCIKAVRKETGRLIASPLSEARLKAAKTQILGQNAIGMENGEAQCLSMGKSMLSFGRIADEGEMEARIRSITAAQLQEAARRIFSPDKTSILVFE